MVIKQIVKFMSLNKNQTTAPRNTEPNICDKLQPGECGVFNETHAPHMRHIDSAYHLDALGAEYLMQQIKEVNDFVLYRKRAFELLPYGSCKINIKW